MKKVLGSNLRELRNFSRLNQTEFGKLFNLSRGQIDSYERNVANPSLATVESVCAHYNLPIEVFNSKDLKMNPGILYSRVSAQEVNAIKYEDIIKLKNDIIAEQREYIQFLQKQIEKLSDKKAIINRLE